MLPSPSAVLALALAPLAQESAPPVAAERTARIAAFEGGLRGPPDTPEAAQRWTLSERMSHHGVPGVSIAVIRGGRLDWAKGYGVRQTGQPEPVDTDTVFSVGSVSKVGAAAMILGLVQDGDLELDVDVNELLMDWKVPENRYTPREAVTLRRILSHTAGLTVHGFQDFQPDEELPSTLDILDGVPPAKNPPVRVDFLPGSRFRYSGGGVTIEQQLVEEVMGVSFADAARELLFEELGMARSSYQNPLPLEHGNIARAHDGAGRARALPRGYESMPEAAASGLWTTPSDLARLILALIAS